MQISTFFTTILSVAAVSAITVSYDNGYDDTTRSLNDVACSDGIYGLETKGYTTQGSLPNLPNIGGASTIAGWNSPSCGSCYSLTWSVNGKSIYLLAIDHAAAGFNIAQGALDTLTGGQAVALGRIDADWALVDPSFCGI